jgi:hypothetical protein
MLRSEKGEVPPKDSLRENKRNPDVAGDTRFCSVAERVGFSARGACLPDRQGSACG